MPAPGPLPAQGSATLRENGSGKGRGGQRGSAGSAGGRGSPGMGGVVGKMQAASGRRRQAEGASPPPQGPERQRGRSAPSPERTSSTFSPSPRTLSSPESQSMGGREDEMDGAHGTPAASGGLSALYAQSDPLPRRISFHAARRPDAHSAPLPNGVISLAPGQPLKERPLPPHGSAGAGTPAGHPLPLRQLRPNPEQRGDLEEAAALASPGAPKAPSSKGLEGISWHWERPRPIGAGLSNLGNTCFLNSVLQCLSYTPSLADYLSTRDVHEPRCGVPGWCALCEMKQHVSRALAGGGRVVAPSAMVKNMRCVSKLFRPGRQEDAHEYMRCLLDAMHRCLLPQQPHQKPGQGQGNRGSRHPPPPPPPPAANRLADTFVHQAFGGYLRSQVQCTECSHCSRTYDPFLDLSLDIVHAGSVHKALERFTQSEVLDGAERYRCSKCKKKVRALKSFAVEASPRVLTIHLKRFAAGGGAGGLFPGGRGGGGGGRKIDRWIEFPPLLDLGPFLSSHVPSKGRQTDSSKAGGSSPWLYSLHGVLVHSGGSLHSGHYYCFVKGPSGLWHCMDDSRVSQVSEATVLRQKAYILLYTRHAPGAEAPGAPQPADPRLGTPVPSSASEGAGAAAESPGDRGARAQVQLQAQPFGQGHSSCGIAGHVESGMLASTRAGEGPHLHPNFDPEKAAKEAVPQCPVAHASSSSGASHGHAGSQVAPGVREDNPATPSWQILDAAGAGALQSARNDTDGGAADHIPEAEAEADEAAQEDTKGLGLQGDLASDNSRSRRRVGSKSRDAQGLLPSRRLVRSLSWSGARKMLWLMSSSRASLTLALGWGSSPGLATPRRHSPRCTDWDLRRRRGMDEEVTPVAASDGSTVKGRIHRSRVGSSPHTTFLAQEGDSPRERGHSGAEGSSAELTQEPHANSRAEQHLGSQGSGGHRDKKRGRDIDRDSDAGRGHLKPLLECSGGAEEKASNHVLPALMEDVAPTSATIKGSGRWGTMIVDEEGEDGGGYVLAGPGLGGACWDSEEDRAEEEQGVGEQEEGDPLTGRRVVASGGSTREGRGAGGSRGRASSRGAGAHARHGKAWAEAEGAVVARGAGAGKALRQQAASSSAPFRTGTAEGGAWGWGQDLAWQLGEHESLERVQENGLFPNIRKKPRYDEWDEELDKGRVKKVKAKKLGMADPLGSSNPFQDQANIRMSKKP